MGFHVEHVSDHPVWKELYTLSNGILEIEVPSRIGPRITALRMPGMENIFYQAPHPQQHFLADKWIPYGGHRLWHAPEENPRSYYPDNVPVQILESENAFSIIQEVEKTTSIQKEIRIQFETDGNIIHVVHALRNCGIWPIQFSGWAISMMAPGGKAVIPLPKRIPFPQALVPNLSINIWPYTDVDDERIEFHKDCISIQQDPSANLPLKIGANCSDGWIGYSLGNYLFVKKTKTTGGNQYPDRGSNVEVFTDNNLLEIETLGPMLTVGPGESIFHEEEWILGRIDAEEMDKPLLEQFLSFLDN